MRRGFDKPSRRLNEPRDVVGCDGCAEPDAVLNGGTFGDGAAMVMELR
jgi:hypothetical protein